MYLYSHVKNGTEKRLLSKSQDKGQGCHSLLTFKSSDPTNTLTGSFMYWSAIRWTPLGHVALQK